LIAFGSMAVVLNGSVGALLDQLLSEGSMLRMDRGRLITIPRGHDVCQKNRRCDMVEVATTPKSRAGLASAHGIEVYVQRGIVYTEDERVVRLCWWCRGSETYICGGRPVQCLAAGGR
jgi:hypothetical protein